MIFPLNYEQCIGFTEVRAQLEALCLSSLGREKVADMGLMDSAIEIAEKLARVSELQLLLSEDADFPFDNYYDMRQSLSRLRIANTHLEEEELHHLRLSLDTLDRIKRRLVPETFQLGDVAKYPHLQILAEEVSTFPQLVRRITQILDQHGRMRDTASPTLQRIRMELRAAEGSVSRVLARILREAQQEGLVEKDASPALRDGRLVIPIAPAHKRKIQGIVHDESGTGRTVYIEPLAAVEANNKIRELEDAERKEVLRILTDFAGIIRPDIRYIIASYTLLAHLDFLRAKTLLATRMHAIIPTIVKQPLVAWSAARHPLLEQSLRENGRAIVPLDISLSPEGRVLIISGPNAGGKSVCLKTVGLLQYMLQCGLPIPVGEGSRCGVFNDLMIDIGDQQSLADDLSTYSSHLLNMKTMMRGCSEHSLIMIDEFGGGTEPTIGGAIAESILKQFWQRGAWAVITTHYTNLKHFADNHDNVANGAMLYNRHEMQPLFQLQIGQPGSSFAVEIARKIGIPEEVIADATEIVGQDFVQSDRYLQDIVRDKRYWENKRQTIHQRERDMERTIERFASSVDEVDRERRAILRRAKEQAEELLREANRKIENTIREIREQQAEKEATKLLREEMNAFREEVSTIDTTANDAYIEKKMAQIAARQQRKAERKKKKEEEQAKIATNKTLASEESAKPTAATLKASLKAEGTPLKRGTFNLAELQQRGGTLLDNRPQATNITRAVVDEHRAAFRHELDLRGCRADEAMDRLMHFVDDALLMGVTQVRVLHGKGNGILRSIVRDYVATVPNVTNYKDEHVQFGGSGVTVVSF